MQHSYAKGLIALILLLAWDSTTKAAERWVDVTHQYLTNPGFTSTTNSDWELGGSARSLGAVSFGCMEMWSGTISLSKTIYNVPNGHYRFSVQALYRTRDHATAYQNYAAGAEDIRGYIYANDEQIFAASQYSYSFGSAQGICYTPDNIHYYPNSMEAASIAFANGGFKNSIEFDVKDGKMEIGLYNDESVYDNWFIFDNFKIEMIMEGNEASETDDLLINEIMAANVDMLMSPAYNFDGWIELYNTTDQELFVGGCYMSDDATDLRKWKMPNEMGTIEAHGYKVVWFGSNEIHQQQATFKLECEGGELFLSNSEGKLITEVAYPEAISRNSYARTTDGGNNWGWTARPTPGARNATTTYTSKRLNAPEVSPDGQLFDGQVNISVNIPSGATLRYTTDGSTPTLENGMTSTTGLFTATTTTTYRFRLFSEGFLPSPVTTRSYVTRDYDFKLPVIVVSTKDEYLYDDQIGVYTKGTNGRTGNGQDTPANWNMDWDRPVNFQYILPESNEMAINQDVDFAISGGWTRSKAIKSFKLKADRVYEGLNAYNYPVFAQKPHLKNKTLQMRTGGNDDYCKIKDAALDVIMMNSGIDLDIQSYQPAVHYLNGVYKGLINVREPNNKDFAYANFGYSKDEIEMYEQSPDSGAYMMRGTKDTLERLYELSKTATQETSYEEIKELLDIDEYINYMAAELYLGSWDWPDNNVKAYRKLDNGKYRFVIFDMDAAFGTDDRDYDENGSPIYRNTFRWIDGMQWHRYDYIYDEGGSRYGEIKFCTFFLNMLANDDFRRRFIDMFCIMGGSVFEPTRAEGVLTQLGDRVRETMSWEGSSPDGSLNEIRNALNGRVDDMTQDMVTYERLQLSEATPQPMVLSADTKGARLFINDQVVPYSEFNGYLFAPVTLRAEAPAGYRFDGWKDEGDVLQTLIARGSSWKYFDRGNMGTLDWKSLNVSETRWGEGAAPLGYGKDQTTTISYGRNANSKYPTYYFRKHLTLSKAPKADSHFILNFTVDDGFVIYVNGQEAGRYNMTSGTISYDTYAGLAYGNPDSGSMELPASLFVAGENIIAVEVHNYNATSSDIYWDAQLTYQEVPDENDSYYSTEQQIDLPSSGMQLKACFRPLTGQEKEEEGLTPVRINEVSGANSIYVNDYFKRNDWVELYNTTDDDIDVEGMYLSDNLGRPQKYQITKASTHASTVIPAHGYLLVWCDKLDPLSMLHASFKIDADGGDILLTAKDLSWSDRLSYPAHNGDETVGRYPDGGKKVYVMNIPTIEKTNMYSSYLTEVDQASTSGIEQRLVSDNNGLKIRYAAGRLIVRSETDSYVLTGIYTLSGQQVGATSLAIRGGRGELDVSELPAGCYIGKVADHDGNTAACKFIITR